MYKIAVKRNNQIFNSINHLKLSILESRMNLRVGFKKLSNIILKSIAYYSCFHVGFTYLIPIDFHICNGSSMEPTLRNNDILLTEKSSVRRLHIKK